MSTYGSMEEADHDTTALVAPGSPRPQSPSMQIVHDGQVTPSSPLLGSPPSSSPGMKRDVDTHGVSDHELYSTHNAKWFCCCCCRSLPVFVAMCVFLTTLSSVLLGYDIGIMSGAKLKIEKDFDLSDNEVEILVGILNIVAAFGGLFSGKISDWIGRKKTVALACLVFIGGTLMMALAKDYALLVCGRVVTGLGVGCGLMIAPLYTAELAPARLRGALVSFSEIAINIGILLGYLAGYAFSGMELGVGWRWMLGVGGFPPVIILFSLLVMPESPRWLVQHNRPAEALRVLSRIVDPEDAKQTLLNLKDECVTASKASIRDIFAPGPGLKRLMIAGFGTAFFQQATGVEAAVYYTPDVLEAAGISDEQTLLLANAGVGLVKVLFIFVATACIDKLGRRQMLLWSSGIMIIADTMLAASFQAGDILGLALTGQCLFMAGFSVGWGPVCWVVTSELFPLHIRGLAVGLATFINRITSGTIALSFLSLTKGITSAGAFFMFAGIGALSFLFTLFFIPETKGKSLEEIQQASKHVQVGGVSSLLDCCSKRARYDVIENEDFDAGPREDHADSLSAESTA